MQAALENLMKGRTTLVSRIRWWRMDGWMGGWIYRFMLVVLLLG